MKKNINYVPSVIFAIIEIVIVLYVLDNAGYSSDSEIMAGLVLIYASIRTFAISVGMSMDNLIIALSADILDIKKRIRDDLDIEEDREKLEVNVDKVSKQNIKLIIRGIGVFIIYIIALLYLLG